MTPFSFDRSPGRPTWRKLARVLIAGLVPVAATGCTSDDLPRLGLPTPVTDQAPSVLSLWQGSWAAALAVGAVVWGLILWAVVYHRRSRTRTEIPPQTRYNMPIEALYTGAPLVIVAVLFYFTARDESQLLSLSKKPAHTIGIVGFQWGWGFNYIENVDGTTLTGDAASNPSLAIIPKKYSSVFPPGAEGVHDSGTASVHNPQTGYPGPTLWLPRGETVRFVLTSRDVIHSFWVLPFLFKQDVFPGNNVNAFEVTPSKEGTFRGKCAELCGFDHSRMLFSVKVTSPQRYRQHLTELARSGQTGFIPSGTAITGPAGAGKSRVT